MARSFLGTLLGRAATTVPIPYTSARTHSGLPWSRPAGMEAQMRAMGSVGTLFAIVNRLANSTSQVNWRLYRKAKSGRPEDRIEVTSHAALDLWNRPNKFMTRQEFVESFQQHEELTGEAWWVVGRDERSPIPLELWPVRPDRMDPVPDPETFLSGYVYRSPGGEQIPLGLDEVVFLRTPNPLDPYRGMGPVQSILANLDSTRYSAEWNRNFFLNGAEPGGIIEIDRHLNDQQFDELNQRWRETHRGVANAHRVAMLEHGAKWVDRKYTARDMQFAELSQVNREIIREAFGFPKPMLGTVDDVNRANAEAGEVVFARWLLISRLERIKQALNFELLPMFGTTSGGLEFDYDNPVPEDREAEAQQLTARANAAATLAAVGYDPAGTLQAVGLPDIPFRGTTPATPPAKP